MSVGHLLKQKGKTIHQIRSNVSLANCLKVLNAKRIGSLLVMDKQGNLEGLVSERDILRAINKDKGKAFNISVGKVMTPRKGLVVGKEGSSIHEMMETMTKKRVRHLPIMEGDKVVGIVSIGDVVKSLLDEVLDENKQMQDYIYGKY